MEVDNIMKNMRWYAVLALVAALSLTLSPGCGVRFNPGGKAAQPLVTDAALATSLDSQSKPVNATNTFTVTTDTIFLSLKLNGAPANTQVMARLTYQGGEAANLANTSMFSGSQAGQGDGYMAFAMKSPPGGFPQGNYQVSISANGQELVAIPFTVQNLSVQKGWPSVNKFTAAPDTVAAGQSVTLSWDVSGATRISLQPEVGTIAASGTRSITPSTTTTYKIIASNDAGSTTREVTVKVGTAVAGLPDLIITDLWLEGCMIYYKIKNTGSQDSPPTYSYLYVDNLFPPTGGSSFADVLKPGQERGMSFSSYQWPWCGQDTGGGGGPAMSTQGHTFSAMVPAHQTAGGGAPNVVDWNLMNHQVKVCADARNEATESNKMNNCMLKLFGTLVDYDLLPLAHLATWKNGSGGVPAFGNEVSTYGAYIKMGDGGLEMVPEPVPQGWIQGYWGAFYMDTDTRTAQVAAIKIPPKLHFVANVGLASNATGSDGATFKFGVRDLSDTMNFLPGKKMTVPGQFEAWDIDLKDYEGQTVFFVLRAEAGASPVNDFAVWKSAHLVQIQ